MKRRGFLGALLGAPSALVGLAKSPAAAPIVAPVIQVPERIAEAMEMGFAVSYCGVFTCETGSIELVGFDTRYTITPK